MAGDTESSWSKLTEKAKDAKGWASSNLASLLTSRCTRDIMVLGTNFGLFGDWASVADGFTGGGNSWAPYLSRLVVNNYSAANLLDVLSQQSIPECRHSALLSEGPLATRLMKAAGTYALHAGRQLNPLTHSVLPWGTPRPITGLAEYATNRLAVEGLASMGDTVKKLWSKAEETYFEPLGKKFWGKDQSILSL